MTDTHTRAREALARIAENMPVADAGPWFLEGNWDEDSRRKLGGWLSNFPPAGSPIFELVPITGSRTGIIASATHIAACDPSAMSAIIALVAEQDRRIAELEKNGMALAAWQCPHLDGKTGLTYDDWGNGSCAKDRRIAELEAALGLHDEEELIDAIRDAIDDSFDVDWTSGWGARAVVEMLKDRIKGDDND